MNIGYYIYVFKEIETRIIFFLHLSELISIMAGKLSQHIGVSYILFKGYQNENKLEVLFFFTFSFRKWQV